MKLTGPQIAAAIALAGISREDLATEAGIGRNTLDRIINGLTTYRDETIKKITGILEVRGVEFLPNEGVRRKVNNVDILKGQEGLQSFFNDVYEYSANHGGTVLMFGVDEQKFLTHLGADFSKQYLAKMTKLAAEKEDLNVKAIICEGDRNFLASDYNEYRWISKSIFQAVPFYIYGENLAVMDFQTIPAPTIVILRFPAITNAYRHQFEAFWDMAHPPV